MADIVNVIEQWRQVSETLNGIITSTGKEIDINNRVIWDQFLHRWSDSDWQDIIATVLAVKSENPDLFASYHDTAIAAARAALLKSHSGSRVMDTKPNKKISWRTIMTLREVWNQMNDIKIPNKTQKSRPKMTVEQTDDYTRITVWHNLFEVTYDT
jgi:hypothetical protein